MAKAIVAATADERQAIYRFRYQVYIEEMQKQFKADHQTKTLTDELDETATLLYMVQETQGQADQIIATVRLNSLATCSLGEPLEQILAIPQFETAFSRAQMSFSSRLMVAPAWRNSMTVGAIVLEAYRLLRQQQMQFVFLHAAPWLLPFYRNLGYRRYAHHFLDPDVGLQIPQVLVLEDLKHLQAVRSPLYRVGRQLNSSPLAANWFRQICDQGNSQRDSQDNSQRNGQVNSWGDNALGQLHSLAQSQASLSALFPGLNQDTMQQLLQSTTLYSISAGEPIVRIGDVANALYVILGGEVSYSNSQTQTVSTLTAQQTFGETNLFNQMPSLEQAVALTDATLLIVPYSALTKLVKTIPELMCRILLNASRSICDRYVPTFNTYDQAYTQTYTKSYTQDVA
jgi:predicted GNAT family N-acyltransferase